MTTPRRARAGERLLLIACLCVACDDGSGRDSPAHVYDAMVFRDWLASDWYVPDVDTRDAPPSRWDFQPSPVDAGADAETDAETPWSGMAPFEPYPLTIETGRRVLAMDIFMRACVNRMKVDDFLSATDWFSPTVLYAANSLRPGTEAWRKIPLACEQYLGDCAAFLRCAGVFLSEDCGAGNGVPKPWTCLPGHRAVQCFSNYEAGVGQIIDCRDYGGTCDPIELDGHNLPLPFGPDYGTCQYGTCMEEDDGITLRCIGPHAFGECDGYRWRAFSCDMYYGELNQLLARGLVGARDHCRLRPDGPWHCGGGGDPCPRDWQGFCADEDTYVDCMDGHYGQLRCSDVIEGAYCVPDAGDGTAACVTGREDCWDEPEWRCEGDLLAVCYGGQRGHIDCPSMGMRCKPGVGIERAVCAF